MKKQRAPSAVYPGGQGYDYWLVGVVIVVGGNEARS